MGNPTRLLELASGNLEISITGHIIRRGHKDFKQKNLVMEVTKRKVIPHISASLLYIIKLKQLLKKKEQ